MESVKRKSNYELLRIITMFMIVFYHLLLHGKVLENTAGMLHTLIFMFILLIIVHVNTFVLLSGYFQSKSRFRMEKLLSLSNQMWFYSALLVIASSLLHLMDISKFYFVKALLPLDFYSYWFLRCFLLLYMISPILNKIIDNINQKEFKKILFTLIFIFSILPSISAQEIYNNGGGYSLGNFIMLYMIGAYFRRYPLKDSYLFCKLKKSMSMVILTVVFLLCFLMNLGMYYFALGIQSFGFLGGYISRIITSMTLSYDNPLVILGALCFFLFFGFVDIGYNKWINRIAKATLGVYLIHENAYIKNFLYAMFGFGGGASVTSYWIILEVIGSSITLFIICVIIEWLRQLLFYGIYHLKISIRFRKWYRSKLSNLGFSINW